MGKEKVIYLYSNSGFLTGTTLADRSPLESDVYIMPPNSTDVQPPAPEEGKTARWNGTSWQLVQTKISDDAVAIDKLKEFLSNNPDVAALLTK